MNNSKDSIKDSVKDIFFQPRVLVVDDEVRIQKACQRLLTEEGCDVEVAENGTQGLKMIKEKHFDKEPLFKALRQLKFYEKAHQLYEKGYHEMKEENELYQRKLSGTLAAPAVEPVAETPSRPASSPGASSNINQAEMDAMAEISPVLTPSTVI